MKNEPTFTVPEDVIQPIIEAHVATAVTTALGDRTQLIDEIVRKMLNERVDSQGRPSSYSRDATWLQWVMRDCVQTAARSAIIEHLESSKAQLKQQLSAELSRKNSRLAKQLAEGMVSAMTHPSVLRYGISVEYREYKD